MTSILNLRLSMITTLALYIGITSLAFVLILSMLGIGIFYAIALAATFHIIQWLIAPYIIESMYHVRELHEREYPWLHRVFEEVITRAKLNFKPKLMIAEISIPNAFAYGSPLTGPRVAVTKGLIENLHVEEVKAVLGHEIGHLRHKDVQIMLFLSLLPAIFFIIGRYLMWSLLWGGIGSRRDERGGPILAIALAALCYAIYIVLLIIMLRYSRLREYFADYEAAINIPDGAKKLAAALVRIATITGRLSRHAKSIVMKSSSFKALLISDPETDVIKGLILGEEEDWRKDYQLALALARQEKAEAELFSTHPPLVKRIKALIEIDRKLSSGIIR